MSSIDINITKSFCPQGHTFRHRYNRSYNVNRNTLQCTRPLLRDGLIPITDVDSLLSYREINTIKASYPIFRAFTLEKRELFNNLIEACEEFTTEKNVTYDRKSGLDKYEYVVPIVDHLNLSKIPCQENIYEPQPCPKKNVTEIKKQNQSKKNKKRCWKYYEMKKQAKDDIHYVTINGNRYNSNYIYKRTATGFDPIVMHPNKEIEFDDDEGVMRSKTSTSKTSITITFPKDSEVNGIILNPEPMKFEYVYDTRVRSKRLNPPHIRVLANDPNYIQKFELYYRSSNTDGQWIKYGIFDGNSSIFDSTKIKFDEIVAKELRLIPITYTGSFEKVTVSSLTHMEKRYDEADDDSVTYNVYLSHNKYRHAYSREMDSIGGYCRSFCSCCCYRRVGSNKGHNKERHREFVNQCNDALF
jgi:hypothetical protein